MNVQDVLALAAQATTESGEGSNNGLLFALPLIIIMFYLIILRPQRQEQKNAASMRETIKKGDRVKSIGGIYGVVTAVDTTRGIIKVRVDKNVELEFDRAAIATVAREEEKTSEPAQAK